LFRRMDRSEVPAVWTGHGIGWLDEAVEETDRVDGAEAVTCCG